MAKATNIQRLNIKISDNTSSSVYHDSDGIIISKSHQNKPISLSYDNNNVVKTLINGICTHVNNKCNKIDTLVGADNIVIEFNTEDNFSNTGE